jgi:hypothetical protein
MRRVGTLRVCVGGGGRDREKEREKCGEMGRGWGHGGV